MASKLSDFVGNLHSQNVALLVERNEVCQWETGTSDGWKSAAVLTTLWERSCREWEKAVGGLMCI